jgi:transcriptional regulator with XRE-family HTH domain
MKKEMTNEKIEYAVGRLIAIVESRDLSQSQLEQLSSVPQPTISKIMNRTPSADSKRPFLPSVEVLTKLFKAIGYNLTDVLNESDATPHEVAGYLATPLTAVVQDRKKDSELREVVDRIKKLAQSPEFATPPFDLYWPGDHTHPIRNADFLPSQVYRTDRSRASTFDFIVLFCADPSYGLGQENEIATQAGVPAIRLLPAVVSRMMSGSFINAIDVRYSGTLSTRIDFKPEELIAALTTVRRTHFRQRALFRGMNGDGFGPRLKRLMDERSGEYLQFASELGIDLSYVHTLIEEPFAVSNPSIRLLKRMGVLLNESVAYLVGESEEVDPIWVQSKLAFDSWITSTEGVDGRIAFGMRKSWQQAYLEERRSTETRDYRRSPMTVVDWARRYRQLAGPKGKDNGRQAKIFG